ncbi:hypothetical protein GT354_50720 [Streptomyces sp. SID3343]|nr:hypothetical protein [Streptomyces sp. SID3343]
MVRIILHDGSEHHTPKDNRAALTAFATGLRQRVAAAGAPGPDTPAVTVEALSAWRPDFARRRTRVVAALIPYLAILLTLGIAAGGGYVIGLPIAGVLSCGSFLVLWICLDTVRERFHLRTRGVTVRVPVGRGSVSHGRYCVFDQRFTTAEGRAVVASVALHAPRATTTGDLVDVRYDPRDPAKRVRIGTDRRTLYRELPALLVCGVVFTIPVVIGVVKAIADILR